MSATSRTYDIGSIQAALYIAAEALNGAFVHAVRVEGPGDGPLVAAIRGAQDSVRAARKVDVPWFAEVE